MDAEKYNPYPNINMLKEMEKNPELRRLYSLRASFYSKALQTLERYISRKRIRTDIIAHFYEEIVHQKYIPEYFLEHHNSFYQIIRETDSEIQKLFCGYIKEMEKTIGEIKRILY